MTSGGQVHVDQAKQTRLSLTSLPNLSHARMHTRTVPTLDNPTLTLYRALELPDAVGQVTGRRKDRVVPLIEFNLITHVRADALPQGLTVRPKASRRRRSRR